MTTIIDGAAFTADGIDVIIIARLPDNTDEATCRRYRVDTPKP